jgi:hypothetical protein
MNFLKSLDPNQLTYWLGMLMLFVGLSLSVSVATALVTVGAAIAAESVVTSYLATWVAEKSTRKK